MRQVWPLAPMLCADRVPNNRAHFRGSGPKRALPIPGTTVSALRRHALANWCCRATQMGCRRCVRFTPIATEERTSRDFSNVQTDSCTAAKQRSAHFVRNAAAFLALRSAAPPWSRSFWRVCRCPMRINALSGDRFKSFSRRLSVLLMGRTFSLWWGGNDKLRGERDPGVNGICDEAVGFDAFHGFASRLEFGFSLEGDAGSDRGFGNVVLPLDALEQAFGFAFISDRGQASGLSEREECQHHARIERADEQLFGRPDVRLAFEPRRAADDDVRFSCRRKHTASRGTPGAFGLIAKSLVGSLRWLHGKPPSLRPQRALTLPFHSFGDFLRTGPLIAVGHTRRV